jgi:hypothetical protein
MKFEIEAGHNGWIVSIEGVKYLLLDPFFEKEHYVTTLHTDAGDNFELRIVPSGRVPVK